ncbi:MAG TPA: glycosyl hydrolase family 65 protein [Bdellovibrionota bacterium]|nr:glycosyl hydrolase family 65 protein [Bdellovibrionota bacterium]
METELNRSFSLIAFEWNRYTERPDDTQADRLLERLLTLGVSIVALTETGARKPPTEAPPLGSTIRPHLRHRLYECHWSEPDLALRGHRRSGEPVAMGRHESLEACIRKLIWVHELDPSDVLLIGSRPPGAKDGDELTDWSFAKTSGKNDDTLAILEKLASRIERGEEDSLPESPHRDPSWIVAEAGYNPARELEIEALLAVSNGYAGTRGTLFERGSPLGPGTLVAGIFDMIPGENSVPGLVAAPDWVRLRMEILGSAGSEDYREKENDLTTGTLASNQRVLDMSRAMMWREFQHHDSEGRISNVRGFRLASQSDRHLFVQSLKFVPENYSARIRFEAEADLYQSQHRSYLNPYPFKVTVVSGPVNEPGMPAIVRYSYRGGAQIVFATASRLVLESGEIIFPNISRIENRVAEHWEFEVELGRTYRIDRLITIFTSRDANNPAAHARDHLKLATRKRVETHLRSHLQEWKKRWSVSNIEIDGDADSERALRFACYNLLSAANPEDERVSIGARALTGNSYLGHVFWDTELFMMPFFTFTAPEIARSLLMYRYHTLPGARKNAEKSGYAGAMFAWESADTGEETTPSFLVSPTGERLRVLTGEQEHHITADVAYSLLQYYRVTGDETFLFGPGAEILMETARFWASRAELGEDHQYHIEHIIGPDEYHEDIGDNLYTNEMARWNLNEAVALAHEMADRVPEKWNDLAEKIQLKRGPEGELQTWQRVAEKLSHPRINGENGVMEQFRGYFDLEDLTATRDNQPGGVDFRIFLDTGKLGKTQLIKQADVVMLLHLFWDRFSEKQKRDNFDFYEQRTLHGSSLSPAIYSLIAARLGRLDLAFRYFRMAAEVDLRNNMGNASGGVHSAAQGGLWQAAIFGFAGMSADRHGLSLEPRLPPEWKALRFQVIWRGQPVSISLANEGVEITHKGWLDVPVRLGGAETVSLHPQQTRKWTWAADGWQEVA